jgi:hypothetical protein
VDDTGARHKAHNGFCTQIGNAHFTAFATTSSKSRLNFLTLLRAGHDDYVVNDAALAYMRERALASPLIARLAEHPDRHFADQAAWNAHLERLGIATLKVNPDPCVVTTGKMNKQIAAEIGVSDITVKFHRHNVMKKNGRAISGRLGVNGGQSCAPAWRVMADCLSNAANKAKSSSRFNNGALFEAQESFERERELEPARRAPRARLRAQSQCFDGMSIDSACFNLAYPSKFLT